MLTIDNSHPDPMYETVSPDERADEPDPYPEDVIAEELEILAEARAVAGPEHSGDPVRADGGQLAEADPGDLEPEPLDVGDTVSPVDREANTVVMAVADETAGEYWVKVVDETVAEYNDCDPDETVYLVAFPDRDDEDLGDLQRYPYPRSKLEVEHRIHDRDGAEGGDE